MRRTHAREASWSDIHDIVGRMLDKDVNHVYEDPLIGFIHELLVVREALVQDQVDRINANRVTTGLFDTEDEEKPQVTILVRDTTEDHC